MHGLIASVLVCGATMGIGEPPGDASHAASLHRLFADYWEFRLEREPERATYLGDHRHDDRLYDYSEKARLREIDTYRDFQRRLAAIPRDELSPADGLSAELFERTVTEFLDRAAYPEHLMPIRQQEGPQITLGMIQTVHPFKTPADCANYAARMRGFLKQVHDLMALMDEGVRRKVVRPKITIQQSLAQIENLIARDPRDSPLYAPARSLAESAGGETSRAVIEGGVRQAIHALRILHDYLVNRYLPDCRDTVGYGQLPDGKTWYRRLARHHTTTDLTPTEIHKIGLDELERIHARMRQIAREVGFEGELKQFIEKLRGDPDRHARSAEELMRRHAEILRRSDARLPRLFGVLPKTPCELREIESFRAAAAPEAYYYNAPDDGSRPAYFYVNTNQPRTRPLYTMEALAYHEAQPGHHLQLAIAQENRRLPAFRRFEHINAFIEGWALYAELLGYDLGGYSDPYSRFGQLTFDAWRSARLVVDTGIHYFGWTRQQAIDFMKANTALSEQNIISEVDRYIAWPGQALAYKIGQLEILRLRDEARKALGDRFDIRAFHDHLLAEGSLPLTTLRARMTAWIADQKVR